MTEIRSARRSTEEPDPEGWSAQDVPDEERVDDAFIASQVADPESPCRSYKPLMPEDEKLFPVEET